MNALARALVPVAHRALSLPAAAPVEDQPLLVAALDAMDTFLADPVASRYLCAARALAALIRTRRRSTELSRLARRSLDLELTKLATLLPGTAEAPSPVELLRALPPDPRAGRRLQALSALLEAHRALAARVRAPEQHRAQLVVPEAQPAAPRRRTLDRRVGSMRLVRKRRA